MTAPDRVLAHWARCRWCRLDLRDGGRELTCPVYLRIVERERAS